MRKNSNILFKIILVLLTFIVGGCGIVNALTLVPEKIVIETEDYVIDRVFYRDLEIKAKKIVSNVGLGYCLEIEKNYPSGETFALQGSPTEALNKVVAVGYPNRSVNELGVYTEDEAYFATQVALWCLIQGYDANEITGENANIIKAIKQIYNDSVNEKEHPLTKNTKIYYANEDTEKILIVLNEVDINEAHLMEIQEYESEAETESIENNNEFKRGK